MQFQLTKVAAGAIVAFGALAAMTASVSPAGAAPNAETSIFVAYPQSNFHGTPDDINGCGPHALPSVASYQWIARGQSANMYNVAGEAGRVQAVLSSNTNTSSSSSVGWKSMFISC